METEIGTLTIRAFRDEDYPAIVALSNAAYPDYPWSVEEFRHWDSRYDRQRVKLERFVAEETAGQMLGWAEFHHDPYSYHPQKLSIDITVHPAHQGLGVGGRLYEELVREMAPLDPITLWANARETYERSIRFLQRRGFEERRRAWESRLAVASFDPSPFLEQAARAVRHLQITTIAEERKTDPQWMQKLYDLDLEVGEDVPRVDVYTPQPLEEHMKRLLENPSWLPDAHFLAKEGDRYVAESNMFTSEELPDVLYQGITGTRRAHRGRGVALALKLRTVDYARHRGYREIRTWNDTLNAPMLHINVKLGFVRQPAWITFEQRVRDAAAGDRGEGWKSPMARIQVQVDFRPFDPDTDFPPLADIRNAVYPHNPTTVESLRFQWQTLDSQRYYRERHVAVDASTDRVVGTASFNHNPELFHPDKYECGILVHPDRQSRGIGSQLWAWLAERLRGRRAILARTGVWENYPHALAFAVHRGFQEKRRAWQSVLEVGGVDLGALAYRWDRVRAQRIDLTTLAEELPRDTECLQKLYALSQSALRHMPMPDVPTDPPFAMFRQWVMESPRRLPEAFFIARDGDRYVGVSFLEEAAAEDVLHQGLTATDPDYMGRGIAWALKLHTVQYAQVHGFKRIMTWNDTENQPMLSINLRLGFHPLPAWITMECGFPR